MIVIQCMKPKCLLGYKLSVQLRKCCHQNYYFQRFYAVQFWSQNYLKNTTFQQNTIEYLFPVLSSKNIMNVNNIYNNDSGINQLQKAILSDKNASKSCIINLFTLYSLSKREVLHRVLFSSNDIKGIEYVFRSLLPKYNVKELFQLSISLKKLYPLKLEFFNKARADAYDECLYRISQSSKIEEICNYIMISYSLYGHITLKKKGMELCLKQLEANLSNANAQELVKIIHFIGLFKDQNACLNLMHRTTKELFKFYRKLSLIDSGIVAAAIFKSRKKYEHDDKITMIVADKMIEEMNIFLTKDNNRLQPLESFSYVSLIKFLRISNYKSTQLFQTLSLSLKKIDAESMDPQFVCHSLAIYANCCYYDKEICNLLENYFLKSLVSKDPIVRIKDVARTVWAYAVLNHDCGNQFIDVMKKAFYQFINSGEAYSRSYYYIDIALALAVFGKYDSKMGTLALQKEFLSNIIKSGKQRHVSRYLLLNEVHNILCPLSMVTVPDVSTSLLRKRTIENELYHRPAFRNVNNALKWLENECKIKFFEFRFLIRHLHSSSLVLQNINDIKECDSEMGNILMKKLQEVSKNNNIVIEINDANNALFGSVDVVGLEKLKRDLLQHQGKSVRVINEDQILVLKDDMAAIVSLLVQTASWCPEGSVSLKI